MKKVIFAVMLMVGMGSAHAGVLIPGSVVVFGAVATGAGAIVGNDMAKPIPACYYEPIRLVKWSDQPGYSFEVAGCDYQAKKDRLVIQE